ncbi:DUF2637 domain-containing protein [Streptomyces chryseus]
MNWSQWALPSGLASAGLGGVVSVGMVLHFRRRSSEQAAPSEERAQIALQRRQSWQRRLAVMSLAVGCVMMFALAGIAAWLSFGAQREYAHAHNGGDWDAATAFALLLDAGGFSLSLIRFFEALSLRSSALTRLLLFAFVLASALMNLLHAPEAGFGAAFLAVIPPLVYAILLEMLLFKIEQVVMGRQQRRKSDQERGYSLLLWLPWPIGSPVRMWRAWRAELLSTIDNVRAPGSRRAFPQITAPQPATASGLIAPAAATSTLREAPAPQQLLGTVATAEPGPAARAQTEVDATNAALRAHAAPDPNDIASNAGPSAPPPAGAEQQRTEATPEPVKSPFPNQKTTKSTAAEVQAQRRPVQVHADQAEREDRTERKEADREEAAQPAVGSGRQAMHPAAISRVRQDEDADEESTPDAEHERVSAPGNEYDEVRQRRGLQIDLSSLPDDEGPRRRAERIYVAHQVAGLLMDKADLARWAGYKNRNSGRNEYTRLEKVYGPILEKQGASAFDLDWSSLDQHANSARSQKVA